jgi:glycosyltransferase involved in cell wall biosynthesis
MPKVSVIIPTHNRAAFLRAAVRSVLNQTFQDLEIIVVDDASEDETPGVIRSFPDSRIRYIRHETNRGQGVTRNDGISRASGKYIALLDDDDEWLPDKLEKQVRLLDASPSNVGLIYTGFYRVDGWTKRVLSTVRPEKRGKAFEELCVKNWMGTCSTVLIRRACFEKTGLFDEGLASAADYDMWLRISKEFEIDYIHEPLVQYKVHDNRISTNHESMIRGLEGLLKKHALYFELDSKNYSRRYSSLGVNYCFSGNTKKGRKALLRAIKLYPFDIRHYYNLCLSLLGADHFRRIKTLRANHVSLLR